MSFQVIKRKIAVSVTADFGTVFNQSIELFKKTWVQGLLLMVMIIAFVFALEFLIVVPFSLFAVVSQFISAKAFAGLSILVVFAFFSFFFIFILLVFTVILGLTGGLYRIYKSADHGENYTTNVFFMLLGKNYFLKTVRLALVQLLISFLFMIMCYFPIIYAMIPISYLVVVYAFNPDLSVREIVKLSFAIGNKNWAQTFLLRLVTGLVSLVGIFLCGVGLLVTFALVLIPQYFVYKKAVGFELETEIDTIGVTDDIA